MTKVDEWRERTIGPRSIFQTSELAAIHSTLSLSPAASRTIVQSNEWTLTSGERKAKRRKILDSADDVSTGKLLPMISVPCRGGSLFGTVSKVLKERGQEWPKRERGRKPAKVWEDVDDHMTILRRGRSSRQVEESPMIVNETILQAENTRVVTMAYSRVLPHASDVDMVEEGHALNHTSKSSPLPRAKKKVKVPSNIRQKILTKSFKGSKPLQLSSTAEGTAKESFVKTALGARSDDVADNSAPPADSPFIYHKKKPLPAQPADESGTLVTKHLNKLLPISPASGTTSSSLRKSLLEELQVDGAEITTIDDALQSSKHPSAVAQWAGTQALLGKAHNAFTSTPSKAAPHTGQPIATDDHTEHSIIEQPRTTRLPVETQALLGGWTPWSEKYQSEVQSAVNATPPAKTEPPRPPLPRSATQLSRMNSRTSLEQLLDLDWTHDSPHDQTMDMTEVAGHDVVKSSFQAAQDMSFNALETQSQLGRDIAEVAHGVLA